jgi:hypothetical protein
MSATQKALSVGLEVLNEGLSRMPAPEPIVKVREHFCRGTEPENVGHANADCSRRLTVLLLALTH